MWITSKKGSFFLLGPDLEKRSYKLVLKIEKKKIEKETIFKSEKLWITLLTFCE